MAETGGSCTPTAILMVNKIVIITDVLVPHN